MDSVIDAIGHVRISKLRDLRKRIRVHVSVALMLFAGLASVAGAAEIDFEIEPQELGSALRSFAEQAELQILYSEDLVGGMSCAGLHGRYGADEALTALLIGTGLAYDFADDRTVVIVGEEDTTERKRVAGRAETEDTMSRNTPGSHGDPARGDSTAAKWDETRHLRGHRFEVD